MSRQSQRKDWSLLHFHRYPGASRSSGFTTCQERREGTEQEAAVYSSVMKAAEAIQAELMAAKNVRRALTPEQNALVALHNRMSNLELAVDRLTDAVEFWRETGDRFLQALYGSGSTLNLERIAYSTKARRLLCLRQALSLMSALEQIAPFAP